MIFSPLLIWGWQASLPDNCSHGSKPTLIHPDNHINSVHVRIETIEWLFAVSQQ